MPWDRTYRPSRPAEPGRNRPGQRSSMLSVSVEAVPEDRENGERQGRTVVEVVGEEVVPTLKEHSRPTISRTAWW